MDFQEISILFVEDNLQIQKEIVDFLKQSSLKNIYVASNGQEGLEMFHKYLPDIVLTDYGMPLMNGLEMAKEIKESNDEVPIMLITSQFRQEITEVAVDIGIDAYLFKPIVLSRLERLLDKYFNRILQKRAFKEKRKLLEEYKGAIDVSSAVTKTDVNGVIVYANNAFCKLSGYSREELIGQKHSLVRHPSTPLAIYKAMWGAIQKKQVWQGKIKNLKKDGGTYYEYAVIVPILDDNNEITEFMALRQDITDLYDQEQYLKKRIEEEVKKNLLETKFSTIGKMAAGITHEINTPLTYIRGNVELMMQDIEALEDGIKQKEYLLDDTKTVLEGVNRIASIVESMREMATHTKEHMEDSNVYASLITALTLSFNKAKQITQIEIQGEPFVITMDKEKYSYMAMIQKQRIEQVWIIIINNALDALKRIDTFEERLLSITIEDEKKFIVVSIKDNGEGINKSILPRIFDPFESSKEEGGIGIGLNVAKRIIEDHNGKIVASNHENGALFAVYLPKKIS